jgi:hypothetical protein
MWSIYTKYKNKPNLTKCHSNVRNWKWKIGFISWKPKFSPKIVGKASKQFKPLTHKQASKYTKPLQHWAQQTLIFLKMEIGPF